MCSLHFSLQTATLLYYFDALTAKIPCYVRKGGVTGCQTGFEIRHFETNKWTNLGKQMTDSGQEKATDFKLSKKRIFKSIFAYSVLLKEIIILFT